ncbi:MAG: aldehyde dehydrogenase [Candidatus Omnitrophica bacterium]|nr:aldehyde dehydrogenase [Candidatus Omnitrophota bacterium]
MIRIGLNGFGRIGRAIFRINEKQKRFQVVAINDLDDNVENHAYLLKYDSIHGRFKGKVNAKNGNREMSVGGGRVRFYSEADISKVPWKKYGVDIVVDASGVYHNVLASRRLLKNKIVRKIIITHSPKDGVDFTMIFGVNETQYDPRRHGIISSSICDVNAAAPALKILDEAYGIEQGYMTTLHPWLSYQNLLDGSVRSVSSPGHFWQDFCLGRASTCSLIPKQTTVGEALGRVLPSLASRVNVISFRVPTGSVSASDITLTLRKVPKADEINKLFKNAARRNAQVIGYQEESLVSVDFLGIDQSLVVDGRWTRSNPKGGVKLVLWYDNEWGYSCRVVDAIGLVGRSLK